MLPIVSCAGIIFSRTIIKYLPPGLHTIYLTFVSNKIFLVQLCPGDKAVDCLMASQWTKDPKGKDDYVTPHFVTRVNAIDYCIK